jgi:hypothetical protein
MTVTERLMKAGQFSLALTDDAPREAWAAVTEFDHIVITPAHLQPIEGFSDANILAQAIYSGRVLDKPTGRLITGAGLADALGTDDGAGPLLLTAVANTAGTLSDWVTDLLPACVAAGAVTNTGVTLTNSYYLMVAREALTHMCRSVGAEWRINPDNTFDAAAPSTLFVTTPDTIVTRHPEGQEGSLQGLQATQLVQGRDATKYTTKVVVVGKNGDGAPVAVGSDSGPNVYKDFFNNDLVMERLVNAPSEPSANLAAYAAAARAQYSSVRRAIRLSSRTHSVPVRTRPGDYLWVYDQDQYLVDLANEVTWRGELIHPLKLRCYSYRWPLNRGQGVYVRRAGATPVYVDLTPWVAWEDGRDTTWEIGSTFADPTDKPAQLSAAFLGVNGQIADRLSGGSFTYTPALTGMAIGTGGSAYNSCTVTYANGWLFGTGRIVFGTSGVTLPTGSIGIAPPSGFSFAPPVVALLPVGVCYMNAGGVNSPGTVRAESTSLLRFLATATGAAHATVAATSGTVPGTWANGNSIEYSFAVPVS